MSEEPKSYPKYDIGKPWQWDDFNDQEKNPICYYIPVGDGLYRPTMDVRIFASVACQFIADLGNTNFGEQARRLAKAGFQIFDLCLATKLRLKDFVFLYNAETDEIPPFILQKWKMVFGTQCSWHPEQIRARNAIKLKTREIALQTKEAFKDDEEENDKPDLRFTQFKTSLNKPNRTKSNFTPLIPKSEEWLKNHHFTKESSNIKYSIVRDYEPGRPDFEEPAYKKYMLCFTKSIAHGQPKCCVNVKKFKKYLKYVFKNVNGSKSISDKEFYKFLVDLEIPSRAVAETISKATLFCAHDPTTMTGNMIEMVNRLIGLKFITPKEIVRKSPHSVKNPVETAELKKFLKTFESGHFNSVKKLIKTVTDHFGCSKLIILSYFNLSTCCAYQDRALSNVTLDRINTFVGKKIIK